MIVDASLKQVFILRVFFFFVETSTKMKLFVYDVHDTTQTFFQRFLLHYRELLDSMRELSCKIRLCGGVGGGDIYNFVR